MGAVTKATVGTHLENFGEIVCHLGAFEVDGAKSFHSRRVDDGSATRQVEHLAEGSGVHARVVRGRHIAHLEPGIGHERIDD